MGTACASGGGSPQRSDAAPQQANMFTGDGGTLMTDAVRATTATLPVAPTTVWAAVKQAYQSLGIPVTVENPASQQLGNMSFVKSREIGGTRMSEFVNCGMGMTGPNADAWRIDISLLTDVERMTPSGTNLRVTLKAQGKDVSGGSSYLIPCASSGRLESLIIDRVKAAVAKP
jgi:hypothetical protein